MGTQFTSEDGCNGQRGRLPLLLWSTNTALKFKIQERFRDGKHHVWCSQTFDGKAVGKYAIGRDQAISSDPLAIYKDLRDAVDSSDSHNAKIASQIKVLTALAVQWAADGQISDRNRDEIIAIVSKAVITDWKPLIFVIPYATVASRVKEVPRAKRASHEPEFIVEDLASTEFEIIEV